MVKIFLVFLVFIPFFLASCSVAESPKGLSTDEQSPAYSYQHKGFYLYSKNLPFENYNLAIMDDSSFNNLSTANQRLVADKLLAALYFGMPKKQLDNLIYSRKFISSIKKGLSEQKNNLAVIENRLNDSGDDDEEFNFSNYPDGTQETSKILARFYLLEHLDKSYLNFWISYVLTSNIMFSPAHELTSSHSPNIDRVYNRLVRDMRKDATVYYSTYLHMISDDNWRRFRSPEDNGREMMEIYLFDFDDNKVPIAGKALQNWSLDRYHDTLVIGLNENVEPLSLFNTTVYNGDDFYSELVKSTGFIKGITRRLVEVYFSTFTQQQKQAIIDQIVASNPNTWQDILLQIVFSKEFLLNSDKPKSIEEVFFSLIKNTHFKHKKSFFSHLSRSLTTMNQASMKYKLGKFSEVPLDTQSFSNYHKFVRENLLIRASYNSRWGWGWDRDLLIPNEIFAGIAADEHKKMVERLVNHIFISTIARPPTNEEMALFRGHFLTIDNNYVIRFRLFREHENYSERRDATITIFEYLSRLTETYRFKKVSS